MRSNAAEYDVIAPDTLQGVLQAMQDEQRTPIAGGTELMVALCAGRLPHKLYVSLHRLSELRFIDDEDSATLRVGAGTTFTDLRQSGIIAREFPLLAQTASWTGSVANQNRGTLGGNIANASPAADTPPALLAYDAELELVSLRGTRTVQYCDFHLGYKRTLLRRDELIQAVRVPRRFSGYRHFVRKVGTRNAQAISKIALACVLRIENGTFAETRFAAASLLDRPARLPATEAALLHRNVCDADSLRMAVAALRSECSPIDDIRSTARYRRQVACNVLEQFLTELRSC